MNTENQFDEQLRDDIYEKIIAWLTQNQEKQTPCPVPQDELYHATIVAMYEEGIIGGIPSPRSVPGRRYATIGGPYLK